MEIFNPRHYENRVYLKDIHYKGFVGRTFINHKRKFWEGNIPGYESGQFTFFGKNKLELEESFRSSVDLALAYENMTEKEEKKLLKRMNDDS